MDGGYDEYDAEPEIDWGGQPDDEDYDPLWDDSDAWEGMGEEKKKYPMPRTGEIRVERWSREGRVVIENEDGEYLFSQTDSDEYNACCKHHALYMGARSRSAPSKSRRTWWSALR